MVSRVCGQLFEFVHAFVCVINRLRIYFGAERGWAKLNETFCLCHYQVHVLGEAAINLTFNFVTAFIVQHSRETFNSSLIETFAAHNRLACLHFINKSLKHSKV